MSNALSRALSIFELLTTHPQGLSVSDIASRINIAPSAAHRLLNELLDLGYIRQTRNHGDYYLTIKLAVLGLGYLGQSGIVEIAQPILNELAETSEELVRLSIVDGEDLVWVVRAQGATSGLRYDPDRDNSVAHLATSASGRAFLSAFTDEQALMRVARQGFENPLHQPNAVDALTADNLLTNIRETRDRGFSMVIDGFLFGMSAIAVPVFKPNTNDPLGVISIAGPSSRLTEEKMLSLVTDLKNAAHRMSLVAHGSTFFNS